jgi:hypothetical protein
VVRVDVPDLAVAAPLIVRQLSVHVIGAGRGLPDLDHQR